MSNFALKVIRNQATWITLNSLRLNGQNFISVLQHCENKLHQRRVLLSSFQEFKPPCAAQRRDSHETTTLGIYFHWAFYLLPWVKLLLNSRATCAVHPRWTRLSSGSDGSRFINKQGLNESRFRKSSTVLNQLGYGTSACWSNGNVFFLVSSLASSRCRNPLDKPLGRSRDVLVDLNRKRLLFADFNAGGPSRIEFKLCGLRFW